MIYVSPASTRATTCYLYLEKNIFHNNRNSHFLIMKSDTDNIWLLSSYVVINKTIITSNVHDEGQDLMSFTNSWVRFIGPVLITDNHYYNNIWNFHLSTCIVRYSIDISNNTARQILSGSFIVLRENTVITITRNTVYSLLNQVLTYSMDSEPICVVQFYSEFDYSSVSELSIHVVISNNIYVNSKYTYYDYDYDCRWLAGNIFQKAKLKLNSKFIFYKILRTDNNMVISDKIKRPIPLSICQCTNSSHRTHAEYDYKSDCRSPHLGSIFPGQTLKVELMVPKQWLYHNFSVPIVVHNTEHDDCHVLDTFQLSQTHLSHECNNYSYTLWPKNESIKECNFFIGLASMPEMFYVQFKPCPLGFTLQENRKSCYCDPVLNKDAFIKSCNLSDETILIKSCLQSDICQKR